MVVCLFFIFLVYCLEPNHPEQLPNLPGVGFGWFPKRFRLVFLLGYAFRCLESLIPGGESHHPAGSWSEARRLFSATSWCQKDQNESNTRRMFFASTVHNLIFCFLSVPFFGGSVLADLQTKPLYDSRTAARCRGFWRLCGNRAPRWRWTCPCRVYLMRSLKRSGVVGRGGLAFSVLQKAKANGPRVEYLTLGDHSFCYFPFT